MLRCASLSLLLCLLSACGGNRVPGPDLYAPRSRPGPVQERHPECVPGATQGPLAALGCRLGCVPPSRPQLACVDDLPVILGLWPGESVPPFAAVWDTRGPCDGWRIVQLHDCKPRISVNLPWAKHPEPGAWCDQASDLHPDYGFFERAPLPGNAASGGGGRDWCLFQEFVPNE